MPWSHLADGGGCLRATAIDTQQKQMMKENFFENKNNYPGTKHDI
jgi:hypothetical protein